MPVEGFNLSRKMATGFIPLNIEQARLVGSTAGESWANATAAVGTVGGGLLSSATVPSLTALSTALRVITANWSSAGTGVIQFPNVILPPDFTSVSAPTINVLGGRVSAGSSDTTPTWLVNVYASIGSSVLVTLPITNITSSVATQYSASLSTSAVPGGYPGTLAVTINPGSSQDLNKLYGAWIEYTRTQRG